MDEESMGRGLQVVERAWRAARPDQAALVAVSGIDASGKGYLCELLAARLRGTGMRVALIHADQFLNLPQVRLSATRPAEHFYEHAFRFEALFEEVLMPLRRRRSLDTWVKVTTETAIEFTREWLHFENVDVVLVEAIFLLKRELVARYDETIWIDCSFETALERALARRQEGLGREQTIAAYETIHFPAQKLHFERDDPFAAASTILTNDQRLEAQP
jgi:uridine kinase